MEEYLADKKITLNIFWNKQLTLPEELPVLTSTNTVDKQTTFMKEVTDTQVDYCITLYNFSSEELLVY